MKHIDNDIIIVFNTHLYFSLGVIYHDGDDNPVSMHCPRELNYIMAPSSAIINSKTKEYSFKFSDCSIAQMEDHVNLLTQRYTFSVFKFGKLKLKTNVKRKHLENVNIFNHHE